MLKFVRAGRTFIYETKNNPFPHLWMVLTDPDPQTGKVILVSMTTSRDHTDKTVLINVGDHEFVVHETNVDYGGATFGVSSKLERALGSGVATLKADLSKELLQRVRAGVLASSRPPNEIVGYCKGAFGAK